MDILHSTYLIKSLAYFQNIWSSYLFVRLHPRKVEKFTLCKKKKKVYNINIGTTVGTTKCVATSQAEII